MTNPSPDAPHDPEHSFSASSSSDPTGASPEDPTSEPSEHAGRSSFSREEESPFGDSAADEAFSESQLAVEMAKEWVRQHQTAAMLGAFAVGAFVGALMRD